MRGDVPVPVLMFRTAVLREKKRHSMFRIPKAASSSCKIFVFGYAIRFLQWMFETNYHDDGGRRVDAHRDRGRRCNKTQGGVRSAKHLLYNPRFLRIEARIVEGKRADN